MSAKEHIDNEKGPRQRTVHRASDEEEGLGSNYNSQQALNNGHTTENTPIQHHYYPTRGGAERFVNRFFRVGKKKVGTVESLRAILFSSWLNVFLIFIPLSWAAHFDDEAHHGAEKQPHFPYGLTFAFSLLAIIPLEKLFDYGGEQMAYYLGTELGDLLIITLNNVVEATLAIILLVKCELRLLQSTIIGVVILHLLLIPGTAFLVGGARVIHQDLHPHATELNHTLLLMGVLTLLLPAAFFASIDRGAVSISTDANFIVNDETRRTFLTLSRGLAIILLTVYICSRIFLHNPPGDDNALMTAPNAPKALKDEEHHLEHGDPEVSQWVCIAVLVVTIALMAVTAEWLVDSIEFVRGGGHITEEWFGLILLPVVSFAADGTVAIGAFFAWVFEHTFGRRTAPTTLAKARGIDLSIQFTLFWMPFLVLLGWWTNKPLSLLFDFYEVAVLIGSCFLVNYVTADAKTNWAEGFAMVTFYVMIALTTWFYSGQVDIEEMSNFGGCFQAAAEGAAEGASEIVAH